MKLDSNLVWQEAQAAIKGNREVLLALAGVFFMIPALAFALLYPQPQTAAAMTPQQAATVVENFYREAFPFLLPVLAAQIVGAMTILTLFTDRTRPTVGGAIGHGVIDAVVFLGAMLLFWIASGVALGLVIGLVSLTGNLALVTMITAAGLGVMLYCLLRMSLVMPVIAVEGERNPVLALRRGWTLTRRNAARIFLIVLLLFLVYMVITTALTAVGGIAFGLALGAKAGEIATAVLTSAAGAVFTLYVIAMLAMIHRQLAGPSAEAIGATFD
jgi:hypothetical protein